MKYKNDPLLKIFVVCMIGTVIIFGYYITVWKDHYNQAMNTIAELKCPMMQYETRNNSPILKNLFIAQNFTLYHNTNLECYWKYTDFYIDCYNEGILILRMEREIQKQNFTTGRYIDGKIECLAEYNPCIHSCTCTGFGCSNEKCLKEKEFELCYKIHKTFTLEELGIDDR